MLKTFSAIAMAVTMLAAPAMAAGPVKVADKATAPVAGAVSKTVSAPRAKPSVLNAKASVERHHIRHHHRFHHKVSQHKTLKHTAVRAGAAHVKHG